MVEDWSNVTDDEQFQYGQPSRDQHHNKQICTVFYMYLLCLYPFCNIVCVFHVQIHSLLLALRSMNGAAEPKTALELGGSANSWEVASSPKTGILELLLGMFQSSMNRVARTNTTTERHRGTVPYEQRRRNEIQVFIFVANSFALAACFGETRLTEYCYKLTF